MEIGYYVGPAGTLSGVVWSICSQSQEEVTLEITNLTCKFLI